MYRRFMTVLAAVVALTLVGIAPGALAVPQDEEPARDPEAVEILERADAALDAAPALQFDFQRTGTYGSTGRTSGHAVVERASSFSAMRFRGEVKTHLAPNIMQGVGSRVEVANDGERVRLLDHEAGVLHVGSAAGGAGSLQRPVSQFILPLMFRSLQSVEIDQPERIQLAGTAEVDGVLCDVVYLDFPDDSGFGEQYFYVGRDDHLPRRIVFTASGANNAVTQFDFVMTDLEVVDPAGVDFGLDAPDDYVVDDAALSVAPGALAANWELNTPAGEIVRMEDLRGKVVVLDFWASWCPICRNQLPMVSRVAEDLEGLPVEFYGINVWENADPLAFLDEIGADIPVLLEGEDVATLYRISGTGTIVVITPEGRFLPRMYGNTTRESLTEAIHSVLPDGGAGTTTAASESDES